MKYIKSFESISKQSDIKSYCEMHLAYLIDNGFLVFQTITIDNTYIIDIKRDDREKFYFNDIEDEFIPFINTIDDKYEIISYSNPYYESDDYQVRLIINNNMNAKDYRDYNISELNDVDNLKISLVRFTLKVK